MKDIFNKNNKLQKPTQAQNVVMFYVIISSDNIPNNPGVQGDVHKIIKLIIPVSFHIMAACQDKPVLTHPVLFTTLLSGGQGERRSLKMILTGMIF